MQLSSEETLPEGLKRIAREELDAAAAHLGGEQGADAAERVHEARKSLKKARAVIRLARKEVGADVFDRENRRFRDAGRRLAPLREAEVHLGTLDRLADTEALGTVELRGLRSALAEHRDRTCERLIDGEDALAEVAAAVSVGRELVDSWPIDRVGSKAFRKSLRKTYRRGRKAFAKAYEEPSPEAFHELRKCVKYLWYYARILEPAAPDEIGELEAQADQVADLLGLDHDLAELLEAAGGEGVAERQLLERLERVVEQERLALQWRALPLLRRIFAEPPKGIAHRLAGRFDAWRFEGESRPMLWLTPRTADHVRELLAAKQVTGGSEAKTIRVELRAAGIELSRLAPLVPGAGAGFGPEHFDELVARGLIRVGDAADFARPHVDRLLHTAVDVGPNEASGICPISSPIALEARGWDQGFWVILDDTSVAEGIVAVGRKQGDEGSWEALPLPVAAGDHPDTDDGEDCLRIGEWVYVFGSHYGSKEGPLEQERQFVARFREAQLAEDEVDLHVVCTEFRLHRLINDALAASDTEIFPLAEQARTALVGGALDVERDEPGDRDQRIEPDDQPINIEGAALRFDTGGVLVGLRVPTSAAGHPLLVEVDGLERLFEPGGELPTAKGVWEVPGIGNPSVPAGIRGLAEGADGAIEALTGNLDSTGKGSVMIAAHPEAALARSAHFRLNLPGNRRSGEAEAELVREFPGFSRIEGIARDPSGRFFYVIDEEEHVDLRYSEPLGSPAS